VALPSWIDVGRRANWAAGGHPVSRRRGAYISGFCQHQR
jgi:hypothetical protein